MKGNRRDKSLAEGLDLLREQLYIAVDMLRYIQDHMGLVQELEDLTEKKLNIFEHQDEIYQELNTIYEGNSEYMDFISLEEIAEDEYYAED